MSIQEHYNCDKLMKIDANIYLIVGEKSNGKSYQFKNKWAVDRYLKTNNRFALIRRWDADMSNSWVQQYFNDVDVSSKTDNKYSLVVPYRKAIYFGNIDEKTMRPKAKEKIGYIMPLSLEQHFSSR